MRPTDELDGNASVPFGTDLVIDLTVEDDEEEDDEDEDDELPDDACDCPLYDTPGHLGDDCPVCHGRRWVEEGDIDAFLGPSRLPCLLCGGEGGEESGGPVTWTCVSCLGTGFMPTALLAQFDLTKYPDYDQEWRNADLSGQNLGGATFESCDFTDANFDGADLTNTTFEDCQFAWRQPGGGIVPQGSRIPGHGTHSGATCRLCGSWGHR